MQHDDVDPHARAHSGLSQKLSLRTVCRAARRMSYARFCGALVGPAPTGGPEGGWGPGSKRSIVRLVLESQGVTIVCAQN